MPGPNITLDVGKSIPAGFVVGRLNGGTGPATLIPIADLAGVIAASGAVALPGASSGSGGGSSTLAGDTDVAISSPANNDILHYQTSDGKWHNTAPSGGGAGGGLYSSVMSATPTMAGTGLSTALGTGAAVADSTAGVFLTGTAGNTVAAVTTTVPATPYSITALLATPIGIPALGWSDGTKYHFMYSVALADASNTGQLNVQKNSTLTAFSGTDVFTSIGADGQLIWYKLRDDGTNVTFGVSRDGVNFATMFSTTKAAGYLGATGYSKLAFLAGPQFSSPACLATVLSWTQGT